MIILNLRSSSVTTQRTGGVHVRRLDEASQGLWPKMNKLYVTFVLPDAKACDVPLIH